MSSRGPTHVAEKPTGRLKDIPVSLWTHIPHLGYAMYHPPRRRPPFNGVLFFSAAGREKRTVPESAGVSFLHFGCIPRECCGVRSGPVVPSSPRARLRPGRQAPRRICLASAQFPLQRRLFQPRSKRHSGSSRLPGPEWQESIQRAHHMLPRDSPHRLRPPSASVCCSPRVPASAHEPWFLRQTPLIF
ncbi:unnamed protein product [Rangifer tarandus platyrhynchus]|uniref:Uncharacterized protein n=1 Tax=Rangifer tarandus platyrhynchus TaxID=3082113 RepID=A0AC59Y2B9_RANTA